MAETRIKINSVVENQLPEFVKDEFPLVSEFLKQYYISQESQGSSYDLIQNIDKYIKVDILANLIDSTSLTEDVSFSDEVINVISTAGFPNSYGLLLIDSEIISYTGKTQTSFTGCLRGFSGTTSLQNSINPDELVFSDSDAEVHTTSSKVKNLSILFLQEFFNKLKIQITPGFEGREFYSQLNDSLFIKQSKDFYTSKGTEQSFEILFRALYGKDVAVIKPQEYLIQPSDAQYKITKDLVVESISGDPYELLNRTIYQDQTSIIPRARGTVTQVEKIQRGEREFFVLSLDYGYQRDIDVEGTIFGEFSIHPKTINITDIQDIDSSVDGFLASSTSLDVDSTVGFPQSGTLTIDLQNDTQMLVSYEDKTLTQFLGCSNISQPIPSGTEIKTNDFAYGFGEDGTVTFRVTGVLSEVKLVDDNAQFSVNDPIKIKTLGDEFSDYKYNNWFFNISTTLQSSSIQLLDSSNYSYAINFFDEHSFVIGDRVSLLPSYGRPGQEKFGFVVSYGNKKSIVVSGQGILDTSVGYDVRKILSRLESINYPELNKYTTNVQNVYVDNEKSLYVAAPSLPTYLNQKLKVNDRSVVFSGSFDGINLTIPNHPFFTGDAVYYRSGGDGNNLGIDNGFYFVRKSDNNTINLAKSRSNIDSGLFVSVNGTVTDNRLEISNFVSESSLELNVLEPQKILRKISDPANDGGEYDTSPGSTGILVNGVEILNYKSADSIYYGAIESIIAVGGGNGYDVINPPVLRVSDVVGSGATVHCAVKGNLERIDVIDGGFDYLDTPEIKILGGNGFGAEVKANLISFRHFVKFNAEQTSGAVDDTNDIISFIDDHRFRDYEQVVYDPQGELVVTGLSTNSSYFVSVVDSRRAKFYNSYSDSILGINTIAISNTGSGIQRFNSVNVKKKIGSVTVINPGSNYRNKKTTATIAGINTASNIINIANHGYESGEIITYDFTEVPVVGLSSTSSYYVTKIDDNNFKLSVVSTSSTQPNNINYTIKNYVDLIDIGSGIHIFNHEPITVSVNGSIGVSTLSGQNFNATLQPIFRGSIESVSVQSGGNSYGSQEILNYDRQPELLLLSGSEAQLTPVINNGSIIDVVINSPGQNYNSPPTIVVNGTGNGAVLTPNISNGQITSVNVIFGGVGYSSSDTNIDVISAGQGAKFKVNIKSWTINLFERYLQTGQITDDDGILGNSLSGFGLQYFHLYSPRKLRSSVLSTRFKDGEIFYEPDLKLINGREVSSIAHSPIIGWAYDGNPIYGPYGYTSTTGGSIKSMVSGYQIKLKPERPSTALYPVGFFIEDYEFVGSGDLDEHNGRFAVTPEYPNGVYAYFTTISDQSATSSGSFTNYKLPVFPYFIGDCFKSKPIDFNYKKSSQQTEIDINTTNWIRNTTPYNISKSNSTYQFLYNPNDIREQISHVKSVTKGEISFVGILTGGNDFQPSDRIIFKETDLSSRKPTAGVLRVKGKEVTSVSVATSELVNVELYPSSDKTYIGFSTAPHYFNNGDIVSIASDFESKKLSNVRNSINVLYTASGIGSTSYTGIITYFNVYGNLESYLIRENDVYQIFDEKVKVLNVDKNSSRIRVLRNIDQISGISSYSAGIALTEVTRKLFLDFEVDNEYETAVNTQYYFDPIDSVGIGTTEPTATITFSNPGVGATQITIPTRSIYLPNHQISSGDELIYSSNGGTQISISTDGVSSYQLQDNSVVYATKLTSELIGISSYRVGLGTTGSFVGISTAASLLYFTGIGSGQIHSFSTNYQNVLTSNIFKNEVTVSTASTHGLNVEDFVNVTVLSGITTNISISYNDYNRRMVVNKIEFLSSAVDTARNTITLPDHGLYTSQKVIYTSSSPSGGLNNEGIYYVVVIDDNTIKLSSSYYYSSRQERNIVNITSASSGSISPVNPPINLIDRGSINFDVSSSTLSFTNSGILYSAFDLEFYTDPLFKYKFNFSSASNVEVIKNGRVGIDTNAVVTLRVTENTPQKIYYKLTPANILIAPSIKKEIIVDIEIVNHNSISVIGSKYNGVHSIVGVSSNTFKYNLTEIPEKSDYNQTNSTIRYSTNSSNAYGEIESVVVNFAGFNLTNVPQINTISSKLGNREILEVETRNIGKVLKTKIDDIGFGYSNDLSIRPTAKLPEVIKIVPQSSFEFIGVSSVGKGYSLSPNLVVVDGFTKKVVDDVDLRYNIDSKTVDIVKNTKSINNVTPSIIPINNSNGIGISSIRYIPSSKDVVVTLGASFSDPQDFPFEIGKKVLIENVSVGVGSTAKGYNSSNYNYTLFTIVNTDPNLGGVGATVSYNLAEYISDTEVPGSYDAVNSAGRIIAEKDFPIFDIILKKNTFNIGESVSSNGSSGIVVGWDPNTEILKVSSNNTFNVNDIIVGESSMSRGRVDNVTSTNCQYVIGAGSTVEKGWQKETGILSNQFQRIHDNDYYQYFSYSLKSEISLEKWDNAVANLNHTSGFKRFSDLIIESEKTDSGISTEQNLGDFVGIADFSQVVDLNCVYDFDLVKENNLKIDGLVKSDEIIFNSRVIQDYIESVGNRVLMIDDFSDTFSSEPRSTRFSIVDTFNLDTFGKKYITFVEDMTFTAQKQIMLVSLLHDNSNGYLNQYGRSETVYDMGSFDFNITGTEGNLLFYPTRFSINNYNVSVASYNIREVVSGVGSTSFGDIVKIESSTANIPIGTSSATTIVGIASTYRSSKVLVQIGSTTQSYFETDELIIIHDGTNVYLQEYGQLNTGSISSFSTPGFGTFFAYLSGSNLNIDLIPYSTTTVEYNVNCLRVSIADTSSTSSGISTFNNSTIKSTYTSIAASGSPGITTISTYQDTYDCAYYIVSVEDTTNGEYQVSEVVLADDESNAFISEFGIIQTGASLGTIGGNVTPSGAVDLTFTPSPGIDVQVRVYQHALGLVDVTIPETIIDFTNAYIETGYGFYYGTEVDVKRQFGLTHKQKPIFERYFDGSDSSIVKVGSNQITLPENFFVTGEEVSYVYSGAGTTSAIGIVTATIPGIGVTDKMPSTVFIVKNNELTVQVAASSSEALSTSPTLLEISSVGIGTSHRFIAKNQNAKAIITIDNVIQSPIVSTAITTTLASVMPVTTNKLEFSGITSFFGGDLIRINNEIMRIDGVGIGASNIVFVQRQWMGTGISTHDPGSLITKISGDYNIVDNTINFITAPYGLKPIASTTNPPDERDWIGIQTHSTFSGRTFMRSGVTDTSAEPYSKNYIFDDISDGFNGINKEFTLKSQGVDIAGFSTSNAVILINEIFQGPERSTGSVLITGDYDISESAGISSITFTGSASSTAYDVNAASIPVGGVIVSVASTEGLGYQPLVAAGGTATVSIAGTISAISIGNSGSGYRVGVQTVNVGVALSSTGIPEITYVGTATVVGGHVTGVAITNPGVGYTSTNIPYVIFDAPLSYSNIPLIYSSTSSGIGTEAYVDVVVGQGSSVISFEITKPGYGFGQSEVLTVDIGGATGIPTDPSISFKEFQITVDRTASDTFNGWTLGDLQVIDPIDSLFDGERVNFPIKINGDQTTIRARRGSNIEVKACLLIFINDILQVPDISYTFNGGSIITFSEPPKPGDLSKILFYKGTGSVDTLNVDILETVKEGDTLTITSGVEGLRQNTRLVTDVVSTDIAETNVYPGPGVTQDANLLRPVVWCRQTEDKIINGEEVAKDRILYEPVINPTSNLIQSVSIASTQIFVENVKTFFDNASEYLQDGTSEKPQRKITIISQDQLVSAAATAIVSAAGTISSIIISDGGVGYSTNPNVIIENPVGLGTTQRATATSIISVGGTVSSISISNPGTGYTTTSPPVVLIESSNVIRETIDDVLYEGDFGVIVGISTVTVGVASTGIVFDLFIPENSFIRDMNVNTVGIATTGVSGIQTGYYFVVFNSNVGNGLTSIYQDGSTLSIGSTFIDNVYEVASVSIAQTSAPGIGLTYVAKVTVSVSDYNGLSGIGYSSFYGEYSWGRIHNLSRSNAKAFNYYNNGLVGVSTSPTVHRYNPLKYRNYV